MTLEEMCAAVAGEWVNERRTAFTSQCDVVALVGGQLKFRCTKRTHSEEKIKERVCADSRDFSKSPSMNDEWRDSKSDAANSIGSVGIPTALGVESPPSGYSRASDGTIGEDIRRRIDAEPNNTAGTVVSSGSSAGETEFTQERNDGRDSDRDRAAVAGIADDQSGWRVEEIKGDDAKGGDANEAALDAGPSDDIAKPVSVDDAGGLGTKANGPAQGEYAEPPTKGEIVSSVVDGPLSHQNTEPMVVGQELLSRVPPQDISAEQSFLGSIFLLTVERKASEVMAICQAKVGPTDFYRPSHGVIYEAMIALADGGQDIDAITMTAQLRHMGKLEAIGGAGYIAELAASVPTAGHIASYAGSIREAALKRDVASRALELANYAYNGVSGAALVGEIARISQNLETRHLSDSKEIIVMEGRELATETNADYLARPEVIEKLGFAQSIALMIGAKHHGKTTNVRTLALSVMRGLPIWGRQTTRGHVIYAASDDEIASTRHELLRMGWSKGEPLTLVHISPDTDATPEQILDAIGDVATKHNAVLIVLDMLFDFVAIKDELSYAGTRTAIGRVQRLADQTKALVVGSHHTPKYLNEMHTAANAALGSQGVSARFSPIILTRKWTEGLYSVESTTTRDPRGEALKPVKIVKNDQGWIETAGEFQEWMKWEMYAERVMALFQGGSPTEGFSVHAVAEKLDIDRARAQNTLYQLSLKGDLRREKQGRGYRYYLASTSMFDRDGGTFENLE